MRILLTAAMLTLLLVPAAAVAQKDADEEPNTVLNFVVTKEDNGKPVRNAAVIMHPVDSKGKQERGGVELKTDADGKCNYDGIPYGKLRVQVLAKGFQTYGEDFDIQKPKTDLVIKLKRPQGQYTIYGDKPNDASAQPKADPPPASDPAANKDKDSKPN